MPTKRRRIGFLPRTEIQKIIDEICNHNKLSQSKVTGILVEEALNSRGVLNTSIKKLSFDFYSDNSEVLLTTKKGFNSKTPNNIDNINFDEDSIQDEVHMINDFIEFKIFKNIMNRNKRTIQ